MSKYSHVQCEYSFNKSFFIKRLIVVALYIFIMSEEYFLFELTFARFDQIIRAIFKFECIDAFCRTMCFIIVCWFCVLIDVILTSWIMTSKMRRDKEIEATFLNNVWKEKFYQASTTTLITHLSDIFQIVWLRAVEWARVWSKFFIIECDEDRRLKNLVLATIAAKFRRKTREKNQLFSTTLSILKRFSICLRNIHWINVNFLHFYFVFNHQDDVVAIQRICIYLLVYDIFWSSSK